MIVKNEQPFLDGCLLSLQGLVDEIVVIDTGSADASIDIARRHGARVLEYAWHDDFAAARNVGLAAASCWSQVWCCLEPSDIQARRREVSSPADIRNGATRSSA